jgi:serralysin
MKKSMCAILTAALCLAAGTAQAAAEQWQMTEIYSNADGSVQFLELYTVEDNAVYLEGDLLMSSFAGTTNYFVFPNDLFGFGGGRKMLVATQGFAALGIVTPDYVVPNGFFSAYGGTVIAGNYDQWDYPPPPADGTLALYRGG